MAMAPMLPMVISGLTFRVREKGRFDSQKTIGKNHGHTKLLRRGHMQRPKQGHRHNQQHEIDKDVTDPKDDCHLRGAYRTHRGGTHTNTEFKSSHYWPAGEDDQKNGNGGPEGRDGAYSPSGVAEFRDDFENPIKK